MTVGELTAYLKVDDKDFKAGVDGAGKKFSGFGDKVSGVASKIGATALMAATGGIVALVGGLAAGATAGIKFNSSIEQTTIAMTTMLGSADKAKTLINEVTTMAASTPFEFPELADATKRLVAYGVSAGDAVPLMTRLGDISSALSIPLGEMADLYGKMKVSGKITMEDMNQMAGRGIPIYQALAKQLGIAEGEVRGYVESGKLGFADVEKAIESMTDKGGMFAGMMDAQSRSFSGLWSTIKDGVTQAFGQAVMPLFTWLVDTAMPKVVAAMPRIQKVAADVAQKVGDVFSFLGENVFPVLSGLVEGVGAAFGSISEKVRESGISFSDLGGVLGMLNPIMGIFKEFWPKLMPIFTQVIDLVLSLAQQVLPIFTAAWQLVLDIVGPILDAFLGMVERVFPTILSTIQVVMDAILPLIQGALAYLQKFWDEHGAAIMAIVEKAFAYIQAVIEKVMPIIQSIVQTVTALISGDWETAWNGIKDIFAGVWDLMKTIVTGGLDLIKSVIREAWNIIKSVTADVWGQVSKLLSGIWDDIKDAFSKLWDGMKGLWDTAAKWISDIPDKIKGFFSGAIDWLKGIGRDIIQGLWDGMTAIWDKVIGWLEGVADKISGAFKWVLDIFSPSRVMYDIGVNIMEGLRLGMVDAAPVAIGTAATVANKIVDTMSGLIGNGMDIIADSLLIGYGESGPTSMADAMRLLGVSIAKKTLGSGDQYDPYDVGKWTNISGFSGSLGGTVSGLSEEAMNRFWANYYLQHNSATDEQKAWAQKYLNSISFSTGGFDEEWDTLTKGQQQMALERTAANEAALYAQAGGGNVTFSSDAVVQEIQLLREEFRRQNDRYLLLKRAGAVA